MAKPVPIDLDLEGDDEAEVDLNPVPRNADGQPIPALTRRRVAMAEPASKSNLWRQGSAWVAAKQANGPLARHQKENRLLAQHSSKSFEHYTPDDADKGMAYVTASRKVLGMIDLDPCSTALANEVVKAQRFYALPEDGLLLPWEGNVFLNPPGGDTAIVRPEVLPFSRSYPVVWWSKLCSEYALSKVPAAVFVAFKLDMLQTTQGLANDIPPLLDFPICIPDKRVCYDYPDNTYNGLPVEGCGRMPSTAPPCPSAFAYLGPNPGLFASTFNQFGKVIIP